MKVLVVDDNADNVELLCQILEEEEGYDVITAYNGADCLTLAREQQPALILLDVQMPELDGYEVLERLQADEATHNIVVIFITARYKDIDRVVKGLELGAFDYLTKPIEDEMLLAKLRTAARIIRAEEAIRQHRVHLEELVEARTAELSVANEKLRQEIEERKQAEEQIEASLKEKEVLLQEIHHRVKNNLQIISSLLDMSKMRTRDQAAIELLTDARARIHIMALIHTQLYQSERFEQIDMDSHIRELIRYLSGVYADRKRITPVVEVSGVCLALTQAIPCALALNELIANAFKHAFTEGQAGTLTISMQQSPENTIVLRVNDNGIGIRDDIDLYQTNTMGLKLVRKLVQQQLKGDVQVIRNAGTEFIITFEILSV